METGSITSGAGDRHAVLMSPIMAVWDGGASFAPVTALLLAAGYRVTCHDTLSLLPTAGESFSALVDRWAAVLTGSGPIDLLGGVAFGGATVLALLGRPPFRGLPALLLSAPYRTDAVLERRLGEIADLARAGDLGLALSLLERLAAAEGAPDPARSPDPAPPHVPSPVGAPTARAPIGKPVSESAAGSGAGRLSRGLPLLRGLDLSGVPLTGPLLHLYGARSQLVSAKHAVPDRPPAQRSLPVPGAGMRPQHDRPDFVTAAAARFLEEVAA